MPETRKPNDQNPPNAAPYHTVFPKWGKWEDPWEPGFDLRKLRAKAPSLQSLSQLFESRPDIDGPQQDLSAEPSPIDKETALRLVEPLELEQGRAIDLQADSILIGRWYAAPEIRRALGLGHASELDDLALTQKMALHLGRGLAQRQMGFETLLGIVEGDGEDMRLDLTSIIRDLERFVVKTDQILRAMRPGVGRKADVRRNRAIALATEAVEKATGERVKVSRREGRFANPGGRYVCDLLQALNWPDESVLVGAFENLRREGRVKQ